MSFLDIIGFRKKAKTSQNQQVSLNTKCSVTPEFESNFGTDTISKLDDTPVTAVGDYVAPARRFGVYLGRNKFLVTLDMIEDLTRVISPVDVTNMVVSRQTPLLSMENENGQITAYMNEYITSE